MDYLFDSQKHLKLLSAGTTSLCFIKTTVYGARQSLAILELVSCSKDFSPDLIDSGTV